VQYEGKHPRLVTPDVFDQVQRVLSAHNLSGEKYRRYQHYLKGSVLCGRCHSRLSVCDFKGNGGTYRYFFCLGRHRRRTGCNLPYLTVEGLEAAVERHWREHVQLRSDFMERVRDRLLADLHQEQAQAALVMRQVRTRIQKIEGQRRTWA